MNLQQLRYVAEVERTGSISRAAKNLYMGQPNLSKAIKELESEIRITIFKRTARGVEPTPMGQQFLSYAKTILSQMDELESLYKQDAPKQFKFSVSVPRATYITMAFTSFMQKVSADVNMEVSFKETNAAGAVSDVAGGESEIGIVRYQVSYEEYFLSHIKSLKLRYEPVREFRMCLLRADSHPLAHASEIPYHALDGYIELVQGDIQAPPLSFSQISRSAVMEKKKRIYVYDRGSQMTLLKEIAGSYMWVSPIPFRFLVQNGLVTKECPMADKLNKDILICREDHVLTAAERDFADTVRAAANESVGS